MFNKSLWILILLSPFFSTYAQDGEANFIQLDIDSASYVSDGIDASNSSVTGQMKFRQMSLSWNGVNVGITNNNEIFNSNIVRRKNFFGLVGKNLNVGVRLNSTALIDIVEELKLDSSNILLNPLFLSFSGTNFLARGENLSFGLRNYNLYCQGSDTVNMTGIEGITVGCLNSSFLNVSEKSGGEIIKLEAAQKSSESEIFISSNIKELQLKEDSLEVATTSNTIDIPGFIVETQAANLKCAKDKLTGENLEFDDIFKKCNNDFNVETPKIILKDKEENTRFFGQVSKAVAVNERMQFLLPVGQIADIKSSTSLTDINLTCYKNPEHSVFELQDVIGDCIKLGSLKTSNIITNDDKGAAFRLYDSMMENNSNPFVGVSRNDATLKDLHVYLKDNKVTVNTKVKIPVLGFKNITFHANVSHDKEKKMIVLAVTSTKLPLGIRSVNFLMKQIRKHLVNSIVTVQGNKIIIQL